MARKILILTEKQADKIADNLINEQESKVYTDFDRVWDYKFENNMWYTSKKGKNAWISLQKYPEAIKKLNAKYKPSTIPTRTALTPTKKQPVLGDVPFKNTTEGNGFRQWFIKSYPEQAKKYDLDPQGSFNNSYIKRAYHTQIGDQSVGELYKSAQAKMGGEMYQGASANYSSMIDVKLLSPTDTTTVCDISDKTTECAQFVNDFSDKISVVGSAWEAYENGEVGQAVFSVFRQLNDKQVQAYSDIYNGINSGEAPDVLVNKIKSLEVELMKQSGQPKLLKPGDIVGIYYEPSTHHVEAFQGSATYRRWYPDGKIGRTIGGRRIGHTFNTHVGVVGAVKDGVPLIFHNVSGKLLSDPPQNLNIVWVKRP